MHRLLTDFQAEGTATLEGPPMVPAFDYLPRRAQKEKKTAPVPEIHVHFPANINIGASSSGPVENVTEVISDAEQGPGEPSPSAFRMFKSEADDFGWKF